jgi:hypothetical protein
MLALLTAQEGGHHPAAPGTQLFHHISTRPQQTTNERPPGVPVRVPVGGPQAAAAAAGAPAVCAGHAARGSAPLAAVAARPGPRCCLCVCKWVQHLVWEVVVSVFYVAAVVCQGPRCCMCVCEWVQHLVWEAVACVLYVAAAARQGPSCCMCVNDWLQHLVRSQQLFKYFM